MDKQFPRLAGLAAMAAALTLPLPGQPVPIPLRVTSEIPTPTVPAALTGPAAGNHGFYTEYVLPNVGPESAIHWVSEDGRRTIGYDLAVVPRNGSREGWNLQPADYTAVPGGGLAVLGVWHDAAGEYRGDSIITFDQQGSPGSVIDLSDSIAPMHLASFGEGTFLVLGGVRSGTGISTSEIYLVDAHGTLLSRYVLEKLDAPESPPPPEHDQASPDPSPPDQPSPGDNTGQQPTADNSTPNTQAWQLFTRASETALVPGDDANVYVIPPAQAKELFVVNKAGAVTHLALDPVPELQDRNIVVMNAVERAGQLAIYYGVLPAPSGFTGIVRPREKLLCLYDVHIGALETTYQASDSRIGAFLAAFDAGKFYFLGFPQDPVTHIRHTTIVVTAP